MWAETYDRDLRDVLELQSEVARTIASEIQIQLTPEEQEQLDRAHQVVPGAYEAYLKGRYYWNWRTVTGIKKAAEFFEEAIRLDPHYAGGYAGLADSYVILGYWGFAPPDESTGRAKAVALKALEIDETLAEPHASLAFATLHYDQNFITAEKEFLRSIQLNPSYATAHQWYGLHLALMGRWTAAVDEFRRALQLDPVSPIIHVAFAGMRVLAREWDLAIEESQRALDLDPDFLQGLWMLGWAHILKGMHELGISELERGNELSGGAVLFKFALAYAYAVAGKKQEAQKIKRHLEDLSAQRYVMPYWIATIYAGLDEKDEALRWLECAHRERAAWIVFLKVQPWLDNFVSDPRFQNLLRRMNFPQ
jgi:tetratricopeptide (TPR) repeat protein